MILVPVQLVFLNKKNLVYPEKNILFSDRENSLESARYKKLESDSEYDSGKHDLFIPFIVDRFSRFESNNSSKFLFEFKDGSDYQIDTFDSYLNHEINWCNFIISEPEDIALVENASHVSNKLNDKETTDLFDEKNSNVLNKIIENNGFCRILCKDEFSNPKDYENVGWGDGKPIVLKKENKVILYEF